MGREDEGGEGNRWLPSTGKGVIKVSIVLFVDLCYQKE